MSDCKTSIPSVIIHWHMHQALARGEEQWDSEPQQKTQAVRGHLWHQEEQEEAAQAVTSD